MICNNKGIAIFISLALLFMLSAAVIAVLLTAYNYNSICEGQIKRIKAINSAEAGINYAYYQLRTNPSAFVAAYSEISPYSISLNNGIVVGVWATGPVSGRYTIGSKAVYPKVSPP
jgi:Tfp pilus assembly protein PilX